MSFASEPSWKKHLFLLHRIKRPQPWDYCDIRRENKEILQHPLPKVSRVTYKNQIVFCFKHQFNHYN